MKKIVFGIAVPALAAALLGTPYYFGIKAEESLTEQHRILKDTFFFDIVSRQYERGWFGATETTVIRFQPQLLAKISAQLPDNVQTVLNKEITVINHVKHGLFADGITPVRASVRTEFKYDPEVEKVLSRFFNGKTPLTMHNTIGLGGGGKLDIKVSPFDYEELSGIKLKWQGMDGHIRYGNNFQEYDTAVSVPGLEAVLADKGRIALEGLTSRSQTRSGSLGINLGSSDIALKRFDIRWNDKIDYNIRLNDLVNTVTDLQIGAFINPTGSIAPASVSVHDFSTQTRTDEKEGFLNTSGKFAFAKFLYGEEQYGPLNVDVAAEHLDGKSLNALKNRWQQIGLENLNGEQVQDKMLAALRNEGAGLFTNNPIFKINRFELVLPSGHIRANGSASFNGLHAADLNDFSAMVKKLQAKLRFDVSARTIESFAVSQARTLLSADLPADDQEQAQAQADVDETVRLLAQGMIGNLTADGYVTQNNGAIQTELSLDNGSVNLNGKPYIVQSDEDMLKELEADTPPPASGT